MALTQGFNLTRRGAAHGRSDFGYPVAPGETIYRGGVVGVNASGQLQRIQTSGTVAFAGIAQADFNNSGQAAPGAPVVAMRQCFALTVPSATFSNLDAPVYAVDDGTLSLTAPSSGFAGVIGTLVGIDNGQTFVLIEGA